MGFRKGAFAKVWEVNAVSDNITKIRISTSRKDKNTGEYSQDFSDYVTCAGSLAAKKALELDNNSRIRIGDCDVTSSYDKESKKKYTNFFIFSFDIEDGSGAVQNSTPTQTPQSTPSSATEDKISADDLPF